MSNKGEKVLKRKVVLALALIFILAGCGEKEDVGAPTSSMEDRTSEETEPKVSTDLGSIAVFFPELEGAQEAEWEQYIANASIKAQQATQAAARSSGFIAS